jgi:hypothetical protein
LNAAALAIVGETGSEALSHAALDREAGLTPGEAARHYPVVATCLHAIYEQVCDELRTDFEGAFAVGTSWESALVLARHRTLARIAARPAEARLCFVEPLRGDRELRRRRDLRRRWVVDFLAEQRARFRGDTVTSKLQIELLVGAMFHEIAKTVAAGRAGELPSMESRFAELTALFDPSIGQARFRARALPALSAR